MAVTVACVDRLLIFPVLAYAGAFMALGVWSVLAQRRFLALLRARVDPSLPAHEDLGDLALRDPGRGAARMVDLTARGTAALWRRQADPAVEAARLAVRRRTAVVVGFMLAGAPAAIAAAYGLCALGA